ncbi:hypothetical protein [Methanobacterium sp.]|uniref:hypothetical protein n=1 Tax=Methanobacterium sp. TaxID=2164 RepID=UPI00260CD32F|nr:hypothetical protein [Methanobacterium sp.]
MKKRLAKVSIFESVGGNVIDDGLYLDAISSLVQTDGDKITLSYILTKGDNITFSYKITNNNLMTVGYLFTSVRTFIRISV